MTRKVGLVAALAVAVAVAGMAAPVSSQTTSSVEFPLAQWVGFGHDPAADEMYFSRQEVQFENFIQECMAAEGFEYFTDASIEIGEDDVTTADQMWALVQSDRNNVYRESLSKETRKVYDLALAGVPNANSSIAPVGGGCPGIADRRVPSVYLAYTTLLVPYEELQFTIANDPRVLDAEIRWSECMEASGFEFATIQAMDASVGEAVRQGLSTAEVDGVTAVYEQALGVSPSCLASAEYQQSWDVAQVDHESAFVDRYQEILDAVGIQS